MEFSRCFPSPGDLPYPGIEPRSPALQADSLPAEPPGKPKNTGVGSLSLLQGIFTTQESDQGLLHCRWILYQLSYLRSPKYIYAHLIGKCQEIWQHQVLEKMWINGICYTLPLGVLTGPATLENNLSPSWKIRYSPTLYIKHNNFSSLSISENPLVYWYWLYETVHSSTICKSKKKKKKTLETTKSTINMGMNEGINCGIFPQWMTT